MASLWRKLTDKLLGKDSEHEVPNREMLRFSLGIAGQNMSFGLVSGWVFYFCTNVLYLDALLVGTVISLSRIWDAINDPIAGGIIDKHTFKNGEKLRRFLLITPIPIGLCAMALFADFGLGKTEMLVLIVMVYFIYDLLYSFQDIAQWGMTSVMATTSKERSRVAQTGRIAAMMGSWLPGLITIILGNAGKIGMTEKNIFLILGVVFGLGGMLVAMFGHSAKERAPVKKVEGNPLSAIKLVLQNKLVMLIVISQILSTCTLLLENIYFFKYLVRFNIFGVEIDGMTSSFIFGLVCGLPGAIAILFTVWFSKKIGGMKNILILVAVANIVCRIIAYFVGFTGTSILIVIALIAIANIPLNMQGTAMTALWGDSLDYMEWKTGQRNEASVFAMQNLISKFTRAMQIFFAGVTLTLLGYNAEAFDAGQISSTFTEFAWPVFILAPVLGSFFSLIPLLFIKYNKKQQELVEAQLIVRRAITAGELPETEENLFAAGLLKSTKRESLGVRLRRAAAAGRSAERVYVDME
ncbi:MAG: MFS transporter [Clostridiaceae bacterium]|jgi:Na+/melibiose symporter-like transporter|nr:MFS transporter [Clostridiaceae bacterium]